MSACCLLVARAQESEKNRLFVLKVFVDGGLAILNLRSHFAGGDGLPAFLGGDLACSGENALPDLLLFPLSALFKPHGLMARSTNGIRSMNYFRAPIGSIGYDRPVFQEGAAFCSCGPPIEPQRSCCSAGQP